MVVVVTGDETQPRPSPPTPPTPTPPADPVRVRRARWAHWAAAGKRIGYSLVLLAVVAFAVGAVAGFTTAVTTVVTASLLGTVVTLAPGIVVAYAVKAAEREDREQGR